MVEVNVSTIISSVFGMLVSAFLLAFTLLVLNGLKESVKSGLTRVETTLSAEMKRVETTLSAEIAELRKDVNELKEDKILREGVEKGKTLISS